jgi:hypothetical protein
MTIDGNISVSALPRTKRERQIVHAFAQLDSMDTAGLSRARLAMLAGTTEVYVAQWQAARALTPVLVNMHKRKKRLEAELAHVCQEIVQENARLVACQHRGNRELDPNELTHGLPIRKGSSYGN